MAQRKNLKTGRDMFTRSQRLGGARSLEEVHLGSRIGFDGVVWRGVWGDSPLDFEKAIEWEMAAHQRRRPGLFVEKIVRRGIPRRKRNS